MRLNRSLNRSLPRKLTTVLARRPDGRSYRPPDYLAQACRFLNQALRISKRLAKTDPHLFGPHAARYYRDTVRLAQEDVVIQAALHKVYGPAQPTDPPPDPGVWTQRYYLDPQWRGFRKWFQERYGS